MRYVCLHGCRLDLAQIANHGAGPYLELSHFLQTSSPNLSIFIFLLENFYSFCF